MSKLIDPDSLSQGTEVVISTGAKTIQLLVAGNLSNASPGSTSGYRPGNDEMGASAAPRKLQAVPP